jgi:hypothetical protein
VTDTPEESSHQAFSDQIDVIVADGVEMMKQNVREFARRLEGVPAELQMDVLDRVAASTMMSIESLQATAKRLKGEG